MRSYGDAAWAAALSMAQGEAAFLDPAAQYGTQRGHLGGWAWLAVLGGRFAEYL